METVKPLPEEVKKNGMVYTLIKKGERAAMYKVVTPDTNSTVAYETLKLKVTPARSVFGVPYPAFETFPGNEAFGVWAWCFGCASNESLAISRAQARFDEIEQGIFQVEETETDMEVENA